jgi:putative Mg2+ transporter-C (MgtC) family protein
MPLSETLQSIESMGHSLSFQLLAAVVCGAIVGTERQLRGKAIGIRTSILICLATQVFIRLSTILTVEGSIVDPTRVLGQVVTGVGFLGAGVILARGGSITGVTSAAVVWMLAAIGSTIGAGRPLEAFGLATLVVSILIIVRALETAFKRLGGGSDESDESPMEQPVAADEPAAL